MFIYLFSKSFFLSFKPKVISLFLSLNDYLIRPGSCFVHTSANTLMSFTCPTIQEAKTLFSMFAGLEFWLVDYSGSNIKSIVI